MASLMLSMDGPGGDSMWSLFGSFFYILLVLLVIVAVCWFLLRLTGRMRGRGSASGNLYLVESIVIGAQNMVQLVRAGDRYFVIGVTRERIALLAELDAAQLKEPVPLMPVGASFGKVLERFLPPKDGAKDNEYASKEEENNDDTAQK